MSYLQLSIIKKGSPLYADLLFFCLNGASIKMQKYLVGSEEQIGSWLLRKNTTLKITLKSSAEKKVTEYNNLTFFLRNLWILKFFCNRGLKDILKSFSVAFWVLRSVSFKSPSLSMQPNNYPFFNSIISTYQETGL